MIVFVCLPIRMLLARPPFFFSSPPALSPNEIFDAQLRLLPRANFHGLKKRLLRYVFLHCFIPGRSLLSKSLSEFPSRKPKPPLILSFRQENSSFFAPGPDPLPFSGSSQILFCLAKMFFLFLLEMKNASGLWSLYLLY